MTGNDTDPKSNADILKAAKYLCCLLTRKHKNKGLEEILDKERDYLEKISFDVRKVRENKGEDIKDFESAGKLTQKKRLKSVIYQIETDPGLEEAVLDTLQQRKNSEEEDDEVTEEFKMAVLSLMKTLSLSEKKLDDLRFWIRDMLRRGMDLSKITHYQKLRQTTIKDMIPDGFSSSSTGASIPIISELHHTVQRFLLWPNINSKLQDGDIIQYVAKIGSDFATGHGKIMQKKSEDFDEDGSHNSAFQTLQLSIRGIEIFRNANPGGSELLRMTSKTMEKDTKERMAANMKMIDELAENMEDQVEQVPGIGEVTIKHKLINCMHDDKERLAAVTAKVEEYLEQGIEKKQAGFGEKNKILTSTCMVCLTHPYTYNNPDSLNAEPVMFNDIRSYGISSMHMKTRCFEAVWNSAVEKKVPGEVCSREGKPCSLHPDLCPPSKGNRAMASMCKARDTVKGRFQEAFKSLLGLRCFYPEPQKGGNSNTGNLASRVFKNSKVSSEIFGIPEQILTLLWDLLKAINSSHLQDIAMFKAKAQRLFNLWIQVFTRPMTANVHLLLSHGAEYLR